MQVFHCRHHFAPRSLNLLSNNSTRPCHAQRGQSSHMEEPRLQSLTPYTGVQGAEKKKMYSHVCLLWDHLAGLPTRSKVKAR